MAPAGPVIPWCICTRSGRAWGGVWRIPTVDEQPGVVSDGAVDLEQWITGVGRALTGSDSTFPRPELVEAVAGRIGEGATPATIERVVARVLASAQVVPV